MSDPLFQTERSIFESKRVFSESYCPPEPLERGGEMSDFGTIFSDALHGDPPRNVLVYGKTGVGKTVVTKHVLDRLVSESEPSGHDVCYYSVNCGQNSSSYQAALTLLNKIRREHDETDLNKGYSFSGVMQKLYRRLDDMEAIVYVVIDEIDHLGDDDQILYELPRARANEHIESSWLGVIGISNDYTYRRNLSQKVKDTLREREIEFSPYDANELRTILWDRVERGMKDDVVSQEVVAKCAALGAQDSGSARQSIELLKESGNAAEEAGRDEILVEDIDIAQERAKRGRLEDKLCEVTSHGHYVLVALANLAAEGVTQPRLKEVMPAYEPVVEGRGSDPLGQYRVRDHLGDLSMLGFVNSTKQNEGRNGGQYYEYELAVDPEIIYEVAMDGELS